MIEHFFQDTGRQFKPMLRSISILLLFACSHSFGQVVTLMMLKSSEEGVTETRELVHYYFENDSTDESSYGNDFTENSYAYWTDYSKQGSYSGRQTMSGNPVTPDLDITGDYITVCGWFRTPSELNNRTFATNNASTGVLFELDMLGNDIDVHAGGVKIAEAGNLVYPDTWYHVAFTYNGSTGDSKIYVDGTDVTVDAGTNTGVSLDGGWYFTADQSNSQHLAGSLDDFRIFDEELIEQAIDSIMANPGVPLHIAIE